MVRAEKLKHVVELADISTAAAILGGSGLGRRKMVLRERAPSVVEANTRSPCKYANSGRRNDGARAGGG